MRLNASDEVEVGINEDTGDAVLTFFTPTHHLTVPVEDAARRELIAMLWHPDDDDKIEAELAEAMRHAAKARVKWVTVEPAKMKRVKYNPETDEYDDDEDWIE